MATLTPVTPNDPEGRRLVLVALGVLLAVGAITGVVTGLALSEVLTGVAEHIRADQS